MHKNILSLILVLILFIVLISILLLSIAVYPIPSLLAILLIVFFIGFIVSHGE